MTSAKKAGVWKGTMASTPPTPPTGGAPATPISTGDPLLDQGLQTLKDVFKIKLDPGTITGLLDPAIDKLAKDHVAAVRKWLKPGNPLLHPLMNYGLGALSGRIDEVAGKKAEPLRTTMRKFSDYIDSFRGELFGKDTGEHGLKADAKVGSLPPEYAKMFAETDEAWIKRVFELATTTPAGDMSTIKEQVEAEGDLRWTAKDLVLHGPQKVPEPKEPGVPFKERVTDAATAVDEAIDATLAPVNQELGQGIAKWKAYSQTLEQKAQAKGPQKGSLIGRAFKWLAKP